MSVGVNGEAKRGAIRCGQKTPKSPSSSWKRQGPEGKVAWQDGGGEQRRQTPQRRVNGENQGLTEEHKETGGHTHFWLQQLMAFQITLVSVFPMRHHLSRRNIYIFFSF